MKEILSGLLTALALIASLFNIAFYQDTVKKNNVLRIEKADAEAKVREMVMALTQCSKERDYARTKSEVKTTVNRYPDGRVSLFVLIPNGTTNTAK